MARELHPVEALRNLMEDPMRLPSLMSSLATTMLLTVSGWSCDRDSLAPPPATSQKPQEPEGTADPSSATMAAAGVQAADDAEASFRARCPMVGDSVSVAVSDTEDGVAMTFTTAGDPSEVTELRRRVKHLAAMYEASSGYGPMMWRYGRSRGGGPTMGVRPGGMYGTGVEPAGKGHMPSSKALVDEVDHGARLSLTPRDPAQLAVLREHARWHQQRMTSGECWMWQDQPSSPKDPGAPPSAP